MSSQVEFVEAAIVRDEDELEGALTAPLVSAAVPEAHFEYSSSIIAQDEVEFHNRQEGRVAIALSEGNDEPYEVRSSVKYAEKVGKIASDAEREAIRRNNRNVLAQSYYEREAFKEANRNAIIRDREETYGIPPPEPAYSAAPTEKAEEEQVQQSKAAPAAAGGYQTGGYEIKEYQTGNYETSSYNISEYKGVYGD